MIVWAIEALVYLSLAIAVSWISRRYELKYVGVVLAMQSATCSLSFFSLPFQIRPFMEMSFEAIIFAFAVAIWGTNHHSRVSKIIASLAVLDVLLVGAICGSIWIGKGETSFHRSLYGWVVNLIFIGNCACVAGPGVRDAYVAWIRDIRHRRSLDGPTPDFDYLLGRLDGE